MSALRRLRGFMWVCRARLAVWLAKQSPARAHRIWLKNRREL